MLISIKSLLVLSSFILFSSSQPDVGTYSEEGYASYYSEEFNGRKTASGEIFDMTDFTAAHRTLPFNTFLKVTNQQNNLSLLIRVNDRGPFVKNRILDLSEAAARKIGSYHHGFVKVKAEEIDLTPLTQEQDSLFFNNLVVDCLGNIDFLSDKSISIWSSKNLLHALYISNELYLKEDAEKILICPRGNRNFRRYHIVISGMKTNAELFQQKKHFADQGFMNVQLFR